MCQLKSCLVLKDRVFCPDYNSHQQMLEELGIKDDYLHASKTFVRVELTPPNDNTRSLIEPLNKWRLRVDQDITPEWWDEKADRQRVEEAVEIWRKGHVFTEGKHIVKVGEVYAYDRATVKAYGSATVTAYDSAAVTALGSATVEANDNTKVRAHACAKIYAFGKTTVEAFGNATVKAWDSATVEACGSAKVEAFGNATVKARNIVKVIACDNAKVEAYNNVIAKAYDNAKVLAYDSARVETWSRAAVIYPEERKNIYPAGWTIETHE